MNWNAIRTALGTALAILVFAIPARAQKDTLFFRNGTVVIGEIKEAKLGVIIFDPDDAGDITVQLRKLKTISGTTREFRIETVDDRIIISSLYQSNNTGFVKVSPGDSTAQLDLNNISFLYPVEKGLLNKVNGYASAGYSYTRSSELGRINLEANATYLDREIEFNTYISAISTIDSGAFTRDNENVALGFNYYYHPVWYAGALASYQRNIELGIETRFQEGAGMGNKLITGKNVQLLAFAGLVVNQELSTEEVRSGNLTEFMAGLRFNVFSFEKPEIDIEVDQKGFIGFDQERYRYDGDVSIRWEIINDFDFTVSFYSNYDSKPPGQESANVDYGTVIGFAIKF